MDWKSAQAAAERITSGWDGPGGAIVGFDKAGIRFQAAGGKASLEQDIAFTADTPSRLASVSKQFLAAFILTGGPVGLDDTLGQHLDTSEAVGAVSVARALDMSSGLPDAMETLWLLGVPPSATLGRAALRRFTSRLAGLNYAQGSEVSYTNTGYRLIQAALAARGVEYGPALTERLLAPLGLGIVLPEDETDPVPRLATGYWAGPRGWQRGRYGMHFSASGGLAASAMDMARWGMALLSGTGPAAGLLARLGAPRGLTSGVVSDYALGLAWENVGGRRMIGHGGSLPGYKNHLLLDPAGECGVIVLSNREETVAHGLAGEVMRALSGAEAPVPAAGKWNAPDGYYVSPDGPFWLQLDNGIATWLGGADTLYLAPDGVAGRSAHMPIRLAWANGALDASVGHVRRNLAPAAMGAAQEGWQGSWICTSERAGFSIVLRDGVAMLEMGAGPLEESLPLQPLAPHLALASRGEGPWRSRFAVHFQGDELTLVTNRSRMLRFARLG